MLIDTHTHLYLNEFDADRPEVIAAAKQKGVKKVLLPNIDASTIGPLNEMCHQFPGYCMPMMGLHPGSVKKDYKKELAIIRKELDKEGYIAVGEIGIDLYWDQTFIKEQTEVFQKQIQWAKVSGLPVVIHARNSFNEIFTVLDSVIDSRLFGVFHCFTGGMREVNKILSYKNFMFGLGGIITFKNAGVDKIAAQIPLDKIILETDAPYLSPAPFRGKRNQSAYVYYVAEKLAEIKKVPVEKIIKQTGQNAIELFNLSSE